MNFPADIYQKIQDAKKLTEDELEETINDIMWDVIYDMQTSYDLALHSIGLEPAKIEEVRTAVEDYMLREYGD